MAGQTSRTARDAAAWLLAPLLALTLAGCSDSLPSLSDSLPSMPKFSDLNPFAEKQVPLAGKRVAIMQEQSSVGGELAVADRPIALPAPRTNDTWSQPGGEPSNAPGHLALGASPKSIWTGDAGTGSTKYGKLTASPIVYDGKIFTLDTTGKVIFRAERGL